MRYLLVEMTIEDDGKTGKQVPQITYLGEFGRIEATVAAKTKAEHDNPGMAFALHILAVIE
jgi:hypothetical protein